LLKGASTRLTVVGRPFVFAEDGMDRELHEREELWEVLTGVLKVQELVLHRLERPDRQLGLRTDT
jgi:hypothetical protein